jgi:hypothetical protein
VNKTYATIQLGGTDRNVEKLGLLTAWLVSNNLVAASVEASHGVAVTRLKMQDLTGPEFLTTALQGEIRADQLTGEGREFLEAYFVSGRFDEDYASCDYEGEDEWLRYKVVAPLISAAWHRRQQPANEAGFTAKILKFPFGGKSA